MRRAMHGLSYHIRSLRTEVQDAWLSALRLSHRQTMLSRASLSSCRLIMHSISWKDGSSSWCAQPRALPEEGAELIALVVTFGTSQHEVCRAGNMLDTCALCGVWQI
jgi:hypothetical protein